MKWLFALLIVALSSISFASDEDDWVMHFVNWSNWGAAAELWMNSDAKLVVGDGSYWQNIPCSESSSPDEYKEIINTIQMLIELDPKNSGNSESRSCFDEPRVRITISLQPENPGTDQYFQRVLMEEFSTFSDCNDKKVHELWWALSQKLVALSQSKLEKCRNSPFDKEG